LIIKRKGELSKFSKYLAVDAYFSKKICIDKILSETLFEIISRLRDNAVLYYIHDEKPTAKRGRPRQYDGKVDIKNPAMNHFKIVYQDANQCTGLEHCQARSEEKLYFQMNTALTAVSIAKSVHYLSIPKEQREAFSMANVKILYHNQLLHERFSYVFGMDPNTHKNNRSGEPSQSQRTILFWLC